jgi:transcriptional regulator with XRE-family HTH domain
MSLSVFAKKLRELREARGMSLYGLAKRTGLTLPAVMNLDSGRSKPSWETVEILCAALEVSADEFRDPTVVPQGPLPKKVGRPRKEGGA